MKKVKKWGAEERDLERINREALVGERKKDAKAREAGKKKENREKKRD